MNHRAFVTKPFVKVLNLHNATHCSYIIHWHLTARKSWIESADWHLSVCSLVALPSITPGFLPQCRNMHFRRICDRRLNCRREAECALALSVVYPASLPVHAGIISSPLRPWTGWMGGCVPPWKRAFTSVVENKHDTLNNAVLCIPVKPSLHSHTSVMPVIPVKDSVSGVTAVVKLPHAAAWGRAVGLFRGGGYFTINH